MNQSIREAVELLFSTCLAVTLAGKYHAHMRYAAHCGAVSVTLYRENTPYKDGDGRRPLVDAWIHIHEERCTKGNEFEQLNALIDQLNGYLQEGAA